VPPTKREYQTLIGFRSEDLHGSGAGNQVHILF
jgi:hypothetical protein